MVVRRESNTRLKETKGQVLLSCIDECPGSGKISGQPFRVRFKDPFLDQLVPNNVNKSDPYPVFVTTTP